MFFKTARAEVRRKERQSNEKFRPKASEGVFTHSSAAQAGTRRCFLKRPEQKSDEKNGSPASEASNRARETEVRRKERRSNEKFRPKASEGVFTYSSAAQAGTRRCFFKRPEQKSDEKNGSPTKSPGRRPAKGSSRTPLQPRLEPGDVF